MSRYTRIRELGSGGMGTVYMGTRDMPGGPPQAVALKALPEHRSHRAYVVRGARLAMDWHHPALAAVYDIDDDHVVMEWIDGLPADRAAALSPLPPPVLRAVLLAVRGALTELGRHGVTHRDIKPDNIVIGYDGRIVLIDYDLASAGGLAPTITSAYKGTPAYSSPEQLAEHPELGIDADVYSLAATAYHLVTGQPPYGRGDAAVIRGRLAHDTPAPLPDDLPDDLADWIMVGLRLRAGELVLTGPVASSAEIAGYLAALPVREATELPGELLPQPSAGAPASQRPRAAGGWLMAFGVVGAAAAVVFANVGAAPVPQVLAPAPVPDPTPAPICPEPDGAPAPELSPDNTPDRSVKHKRAPVADAPLPDWSRPRLQRRLKDIAAEQRKPDSLLPDWSMPGLTRRLKDIAAEPRKPDVLLPDWPQPAPH